MTEILSWIKNIVFFLILISAVVKCIANNTYKRYIVFFSWNGFDSYCDYALI